MVFLNCATIFSFVLITVQDDLSLRSEPIERQREYVPPDCGVEALYILLNSEGHSVRIDDLRQELPPPRPGGYSMAELQRAALRLGQALEGRRLDQDDFPLAKPVIVYLQYGSHGHYVTVRPVGETGSMVQISDPPYPPQVIDSKDFFRPDDWPGMALVPVSRTIQRLQQALTLCAALGLGVAGVALLAWRRGPAGNREADGSNSARELVS